MHNEVKQFIKSVRKIFPHKFRNKRVLEVGSHDINGTIRKLFWICRYTGVDISHGKGVDIVGRLSDVHLQLSRYQTVISTECLEHDETWEKTLRIMYDSLDDEGLLVVTCAGPDRAEHGTKRTTPQCSPDTTDYYRNISREDFKRVLPPDLFICYVLQYARGESDLQFYGVKRKEWTPTAYEIYQGFMRELKRTSHDTGPVQNGVAPD